MLHGRFDNIAACNDAWPAPGQGYDLTFAMDVEPQVRVSPLLSVPTLSYSLMLYYAASHINFNFLRHIIIIMFIPCTLLDLA